MSYTEDQLDYIDQVFDRANKLINARVWGEIKVHRLDTWRGCFKNFGAELVGAYLLDNLCFRSREQFFSLLDNLFLEVQIDGGERECKDVIKLVQ
ncbi:MAG: hypothetical protein COZ08_06660, partial [Bacteroidetes bacterium CG_4_10_14_3_um_filter_42_6]